jgi:Uma2 family endonuclease
MTLAATPLPLGDSRADAADEPGVALASLRFPGGLRLTPDQFALVCAANPEAVLELGADGQLIAITPTGSETGARSSNLLLALALAVRQAGLPYKLFDSSKGFALPDGSVLSPDASLVRLDRWQGLTPEQRSGFAPLCPDLVVELASPSDGGPRGISALREKLAAYQANGACLGWLLLPEERSVEIWPASGEPQRIEVAEWLEGGEVLPGLRLALAEIWAG